MTKWAKSDRVLYALLLWEINQTICERVFELKAVREQFVPSRLQNTTHGIVPTAYNVANVCGARSAMPAPIVMLLPHLPFGTVVEVGCNRYCSLS